MEVKNRKAKVSDIEQLRSYMHDFENMDELLGGFIVARGFPELITSFEHEKIMPIRFDFENITESAEYTFEELLDKIRVIPLI
ncbi:MAG: hypothetical protein ACUVQF_04080 [Fervidobacterium sp.]|uniref:hypothetical protein n=1 Tax=Fervidobacterium sp. TaxID=1871331 RepID=UPI00404901F2